MSTGLTVTLLTFVALLGVAGAFLAWRALAPRRTPPFRDEHGHTIAGSIAELLPVQIGAVTQWLLIRGQDATNPVLLFLHGGPGTAHIGFFRHYQKLLEKHFVVVQWDQRGAGLSGADKVDDGSLTCQRLVEDGLELSDWLRRHFKIDRIFLVGHSWGSALGYMLARRHPDRYHAFAGIGQMSDKGEVRSYAATLALARARQHAQAIAELELLGPPPYTRVPEVKGLLHDVEPGKEAFGGMLVRYKWSDRLGGDAHGFSMVPVVMRDLLLRSREYTLADALAWLKRKGHCVNIMYDGCNQHIDLQAEGTDFDIPVYFLLGRHDLLTVPQGAEELMTAIKAPAKAIVWFDAGHEIMWECTAAYQAALIRLFLGKESGHAV
jgi:pimeloyl-ACP methyl ester carboxylesterase